MFKHAEPRVLPEDRWAEYRRLFRRLDLDRVRQSMQYPLLVDGRNLYDPQEMVARGFFYQPIGRPVPDPVSVVVSEAGLNTGPSATIAPGRAA